MPINKLNLYKKYLIYSFITLHFQIILGVELNITILDVNNQPISNIVVYLTPLEGQFKKTLSKSEANSKHKSEVFQSKMEFVPHISVVEARSTVDFINKDSITHHIYSASPLNRFSFRIKKSKHQSLQNFDKIGPILMGCNIHDWMSGYLFVVDNPLYAMTDSNGQSIIDVDSTLDSTRNFKINLWHPFLNEENLNRSPTISQDDKNSYTFHLSQIISQQANENISEDLDFLDDY